MIILIPSYAHTGTCMFLQLSQLCLALSEMLFTKQEKGQENQASQQKSLSSPKKEPLSSRRMTVLIGTSRIVKWASPAPFASQSPLLPLPIALAALLLWNKWPGCAWASALWHHPHSGTALSASLYSSTISAKSLQSHNGGIGTRAQGMEPGHSCRDEPRNEKGSR